MSRATRKAEWRSLLGTMTDADLAALAGVHPLTILRWRKQHGIPSFCPRGGAREGAGRPPKGADKKARPVRVYVSEEEHATLLAAAAGEPLSPWMLAAALARAGR